MLVWQLYHLRLVALFTRAWIEISWFDVNYRKTSVALFTRAWIEIIAVIQNDKCFLVALFTRAWIEIERNQRHVQSGHCRPLHEGVD